MSMPTGNGYQPQHVGPPPPPAPQGPPPYASGAYPPPQQAQYAAYPYGSPGWQVPPAPPPKGLTIAAGITTVIAVLTVPFTPGITWLFSIAAIVLAIIALVKKHVPTWVNVASLVVAPLAWIAAVVMFAFSLALGAYLAAEPTPTVSYDTEPSEEPLPAATPTPTPEVTAAPAEPTEPAPAADPATPPESTLGQTVVNSEGMGITFHTVTCGLSSAEGLLSTDHTPQGQFCEVTVTVANGTDDSTVLTSLDFNVEIAGANYEATSEVTRFGDSYYSADLNPGLTIDGVLYFDIPVGATPEYLIYDETWSFFTEPIRVRA